MSNILQFYIQVYITPLVKLEDGSFPSYFYILLTFVFVLHQTTMFTRDVSEMAFNARISDPLVGGTFITLLMSFSNLGSLWSKSFSLWFVGQITLK